MFLLILQVSILGDCVVQYKNVRLVVGCSCTVYRKQILLIYEFAIKCTKIFIFYVSMVTMMSLCRNVIERYMSIDIFGGGIPGGCEYGTGPIPPPCGPIPMYAPPGGI